MAGRKSKKSLTEIAIDELVTVAFAEDMDLAKQYKELLHDNGIPALIKKQQSTVEGFNGIAILVPEDDLDEAHVMIEQQSAVDDLFGSVFGDQDYDDVEPDFYEADYE